MQTRCALVGMPGSGKSTVGRQLARRLGLPFIDMDHLLEQRLGCSISSFFEQHGEPAFRDHETALLAELAAESGDMVLSTGGGVVVRLLKPFIFSLKMIQKGCQKSKVATMQPKRFGYRLQSLMRP